MPILRSVTSATSALLLAVVLAACGATQFQIEPNERFTLAYRLTDGSVRVRHSLDGLAWSTADTFPLLHATQRGPGLAATPDGVNYSVVGEEVDFGGNRGRWQAFGLGANTYSDFVEQPSIPDVWTSAPSVAYAGNQQWLIAVRTGAAVAVHAFDAASKETREVSLDSIANNVSVTGRPGLAIFNDTAVLTFHQDLPGLPATLQIVIGDIDNGDVSFGLQGSLTNAFQGTTRLERFHDLSHDGSNFVLGIVRRDESTGQPLATHSLFVLDSSDGINWTQRTRLGVSTPPGRSVRVMPMSLAALSDGTLLAAFHGGLANRDVFRFDGAGWSEVQAGLMFDLPSAGSFDFGLISGGAP